MNSRQLILNNIKEAVKIPSEIKLADEDLNQRIQNGISSVTPKNQDGLWNQFQKELEAIAGEYHSVKNFDEAIEIISRFLVEMKLERIGVSKEKVCVDASEMIKRKYPAVKIIAPQNLEYGERKKEYSITEAAIVNAAFAVADIGSLVFLYDQTGTSYPHFLCDNTFVLINKNQIVANQFELFEKLDSSQAKNMVFVTGPSRTADIEKVLVLGAHGPRKLVVIKVEE